MLFQIRTKSIPRAPEISDRVVVLSFVGRFADELLSGLPDVLMPTLRAQFGLSYTQISLLHLALNYVAGVVEPVTGLLIDVWQRRWLLAWGAAAIGLAVAVMGLAPTFLVLLAGFAIYGLGSGPLAHTADVVLVETHPQAPSRIFARATLLDTVGALLAPLLVTVSVWAGFSWRWVLVSLGLSSLVYAALLLRTKFPAPPNGQGAEGTSLLQNLWQNLRIVLQERQARLWLTFLFAFAILEAPLPFKTVWLGEVAGMSQATIGLYRVLEMGVSLVALVYLDRWLIRAHYRQILQVATVGLLLVYPLWLFWPSLWGRFLLALPLNFLLSVYWPIGKSASLASVPGRGGTVTAVYSALLLVPFSLLFGLLAEAMNLTAATLWVSTGALALLLFVVWRLPGASSESGATNNVRSGARPR